MKFIWSCLCLCLCIVFATIGLGTVANHVAAPAQTHVHHAPAQPELAQSAPSATEPLRSEWGFLIEQYPIYHQGLNKLNITLRCRPKLSQPDRHSVEPAVVETPDSRMVYQQVTDFLSHYPNEKDYWESVNRNLTKAILAANSTVASVTAKLEVLPTRLAPYTRSTTVTHTEDGEMQESWSFITGQVTVQHHGEHQLNLRLKYHYREGLSRQDYPNFIPIYARIQRFLASYNNPNDAWETVNQNLVNVILQEYPVMDSFTSKLEVKPTPDLPYHFFTTITRLRSDSE
jgi:hypothetical protein